MSQKMYIITDQNNRIAHNIWLDKHTKTNQYCYTSFLTPFIFMPLAAAEQKKQKLEQLAKQAGFNLTFKIKQVDIKDYLNTINLKIMDCKIDRMVV